MPHVTFVHGIANKPPADALLQQWLVALLDDDGVDLDAMGVTTSMVYWADMLYPQPAPGPAATEAGQFELEQSVDADDADLGFLDGVPATERAFVQSLGRQVGLADVVPHAEADPILPASTLEAVPLPDWLKRRLMRVFLRDVHHYLYDATACPRAGETFQIRRDVRRRAVRVLQDGASRPGPHVVIGHSLGSVIAYDVLAAMDDAPDVDALLTVGSPLGISEVRDRLSPAWSRDGGWPARLPPDRPWSNVFDLMDPVCGGFDRMIAGEFRLDGLVRVQDLRVTNHGSWRHSVVKYLGQPRLREALLAALG